MRRSILAGVVACCQKRIHPIEQRVDENMELPVEEVPSRALFLGEGLDGFRQSGHSGLCIVEGSCVRHPRFFADVVHVVAVIFGCDERAGLAEQDGVYKGGLVAKSGVAEHFDASVDDAFGFSEARTDSGESSGDAGIAPQSGAQSFEQRLEPRFPIAVVFGKVDLSVDAVDDEVATSSLRPT